MSPSSLSTGGLVSPSATAGRSSCCHPSDLALCLKVISKDQYFLQTSRLFPHAIYRALSRQLNCHLFLINSNLRPATAAGTTAASSTSPGLHLHSHLTQKCSQWIVHLMEKIKMGLIEAGKSPDPMNRSLTVSLSFFLLYLPLLLDHPILSQHTSQDPKTSPDGCQDSHLLSL